MVKVDIRPVVTDHELRQVYQFRYSVYVEEMKRPQRYANHESRIVVEPLDTHAHILAAFDKDKLVGTVRINFCRDSNLNYYEELYGLREFASHHYPFAVSITTKFMVAREYRRTLLSARLATELYKLALREGIKVDFIDCNAHLESYFESLGYRRYKPPVNHHEYGQVLPMMLNLTDLNHLKHVRSPFYKPAFEILSSGTKRYTPALQV